MLCAEFCKLINANIDFESTFGEGTTFIFKANRAENIVTALKNTA